MCARLGRKGSIALLAPALLLVSAATLVAAPAPLGETLVGDLPGRVALLPTRPGSLTVRQGAGPPLSCASTVDQVARRVGFRPATPATLPPGYRFRGAEAVGPGLSACCLPFAGAKDSHAVMQMFDGPEGMLLLIQYEPDADTLRWSAPPETAQPVQVGGLPGWFIDGYWERRGDKLAWRTGEQGAWRQLLWSHERFAYALRAHLPLATLLRMAASLR